MDTAVSVDAAAAVPLCLLPAEDEGEPVDDMFCLHSFTIVEPEVLKAEVTVISPNTIITIQRMIPGTTEWEDIRFGTDIGDLTDFDSFLVAEGPVDLFLSTGGADRGFFRVVCTPAPVSSGGGAGGASAIPSPPVPPAP